MSENIPQFSVAEFSKAIKLTIENAFGYVKINGEITGFKRASSGHLYFNLKEDNAVLTAVCFRNQANAIDFEIGDGLQICASGKITSYEEFCASSDSTVKAAAALQSRNESKSSLLKIVVRRSHI